MTRYPALAQDELLTSDMFTDGLNPFSPAVRNSIEVEPNHVTLHLALGTVNAVENRLIIPAGMIDASLLPRGNSRGVLLHGGTPVSVLWRTTGRVELEGAHLTDAGWLNGSIRARRADA